MKLQEMQKICDDAQPHHGCVACKLFNPKVPEGCLKNYKYDIIDKYNQAKKQNNDVLANKIMKDYQDLESEVLKT